MEKIKSSKNKSEYKNGRNIFRNDLFFKTILFVVLTIQSVLTLLMIRIKKIKNINYKLKNESIILITEIVKFCVSFFFYMKENKFSLKLISKNMSEMVTRKKACMFSLLVPSILYYIQNIFFFVSLSNIPTPLFQLLYQFRILTVAMFSLLILKKKFRNTQLLSIIFLFLSLVCLKDYNLNGNSSTYKKEIEISVHNNVEECYVPKVFIYSNLKEYKNNKKILLHGNDNKQLLTDNRDFSFFFDENKKRNIFKKIMNKNLNKIILEIRRKKFIAIDYINKNIITNSNVNINDNIYGNNTNYNNKCDNNYNNKNICSFYNSNTNKFSNIVIGTMTTFLATFTSGFSSVFLEFLYANYKFSFWFQSMCLSFFTIIVSSATKNIEISLIISKCSRNKFSLNQSKRNNLKENEEFELYNMEQKEELQIEEFLFLKKMKNYFYQYFDSFNDFLYVCFLIFLNSTGGLIIAVFIRHVDSISRFFITPISLLINVYISSMYFKDFNFTFNFFISLIFVSFSLFFYFKKNC